MDKEKTSAEAAAAAPEPAVDVNMPRGWCIEVSGLLSDKKARIIDDWGYGFKDMAQRVAADIEDDLRAAGLEGVKVRAVAAPAQVSLSKLRKTEDGFEAFDGQPMEWYSAIHSYGEGAATLAVTQLSKGELSEGEHRIFIDETTPAPKKAVIAAVSLVAAAALVAGGVTFALGAGSPQPQTEAEPEAPAKVEAPAKKAAEKADLKLRVDLEGWDAKTSTPVIAHIVSDDGKVDFYHAFDANEDEVVEVAPGSYAIGYVSPVNADGSLYKIYDVPASEKVSVGEGGASVSAKFDPIPADQVTQEQIDQVLAALKDAVSKGDSTLSGAAGKEVVEQAAGNAANAPAADKDAVEKKKEEAGSAVDGGAGDGGSASAGGSGGVSGAGGASSSTSGSSGSGGSGAGAGSSGGSAPAPTPAPAPEPAPAPAPAPEPAPAPSPEPAPAPAPEPEQPAHVHNYNIPAAYGSVCATCGAISPSWEHSKQHTMNGENGAVLNGQVIKWQCSCGDTQ